MADLEKLAIQRDRGYLVRLILLLLLAIGAGAFIYGFLTGERVTGCMADTLSGEQQGQSEDTP